MQRRRNRISGINRLEEGLVARIHNYTVKQRRAEEQQKGKDGTVEPVETTVTIEIPRHGSIRIFNEDRRSTPEEKAREAWNALWEKTPQIQPSKDVPNILRREKK